ncbi:MAG TPA: amidohydrolase [Nocardioidaceae bacterium]|nr:amidohydrolase [Nocardioidaceae bacterium]
MSLVDAWREGVRRELGVAVALRHEVHERPQLSGDESDTADRVTAAIGRGPGRSVARTGRLVEVAGGPGPGAVALRTELDGLPLVERTEAAWASRNGLMHACGHDVHMAAVVAVARAAASLELPVPLLALLQPREEGADSGARDVVAEAALADVSAVVAAHVQPRLPAGVVGVTPGAVNAAIDEFTVTVRGQGGHSGYPHTVTDSVLALASIVVSLQQLGARRVDPVVGVACMVNQLRAGTANNVVPESAVGSGTVRTMREEDRRQARTALAEIASHVAEAHGCTADVRIAEGGPSLVNDEHLATRAFLLLEEMGHPVTAEFRSFGSDDFAHYCAGTRGLMMFVGTGDAGGGLHDATFLPADDYVATVADALVAGYCAAVSG